MTTNTELIARLRLGASISRERKLNQGYDVVADEAADAIEALASERDSLAHHLNRQKQWKDAMRDKMRALQAQLAAAQGQLQKAFNWFESIDKTACESEDSINKSRKLFAVARDARIAMSALKAAPIPQQVAEQSDFATIAGLEASVSHLSSIVDEQLRLLIDVEKECGTDGHGGEFEDGESVIIDRVRAHIACYVAPQPKDMK